MAFGKTKKIFYQVLFELKTVDTDYSEYFLSNYFY